MKKSIHLMSRPLAMAIVAGLLLSPLMAGEAMAQLGCTNTGLIDAGTNQFIWLCGPSALTVPPCPTPAPNAGLTMVAAGGTGSNTCAAESVGGKSVGGGNAFQCSDGTYFCQSAYESPEMSDYLAMAFIVVAGGMIYHFRRRALAAA